ncbi:MBL fold metallo-hydrolase [Glutamicibacter creatinolyticus]|uniref:MBL fold metallo-hydrolase n=1 Tax=Glutamicibacter creatinolyticus TaxID=162496 RepID=A0A5B7WX05_9MICC|nr:MBL fold metallo-hydrolase [Glutamicibacter creatinolyticus]QCY48596.1 MBL fold metallo-hydrolase [Glutamicibacter creatinolyticus]
MEVTTVADGIYLVSAANVNCYVVEDEQGCTLIDAGLPAMRHALAGLLAGLERHGKPLRAIVLTHGHFDHVGTARWAQQRYRVPVYVHALDRRLAAHPYRYRSQGSRLLYPLAHPQALPGLGQMMLHGALWVRGVQETDTWQEQQPLPVPGNPVPIHTPGHTDGHCALHLPERDVVFSGDAVVTLDPYNTRTGPRIVASAATADLDQALRSLEPIAQTEARTLLSGHGQPWLSGARSAVEEARKAKAD